MLQQHRKASHSPSQPQLAAARPPTDIILDVVVRADFGEELDDHEASFLGREVHGSAALVVRDVEVGAAVLGWTNRTEGRQDGTGAERLSQPARYYRTFVPPCEIHVEA